MNEDQKIISDPKLIEKLEGYDFKKAKPFESFLDELEWELAHRKWYKKAWDWFWFKTLYHLTPSQLRWHKTQVECYFLRGKNGWSYMDTWGFDRYLAEVISGGVKEILKNHYGHPCDCTDEQWIDILGKIAFTFDFVKRLHDDNLVFLLREDFTNEEEYFDKRKEFERLAKEKPEIWKVASEEDVVKYKEGWVCFQKYFFNLWD